MAAVLKSRVLGALLLLLMMTPRADVRLADAAPRKGLGAPSEENAGIPSRGPRLLSRREILQAIQDGLAGMGIPGGEELRPGDLKIQSSLPVLKDDMGLRVKRIGFDPIRHETVFELWTSHAPQYLPFAVTTRRDLQSLGLTPPPEWRLGEAGDESSSGNPAIGPEGNRGRLKLPALAKPGKPATLIMLGQNVRITTTVVPLQPGSKGQSILVRDPATARVMRAEVVDEGLLQTSF